MFGSDFLEKTSWKNPSEPRNGFFQYANNTQLHLFEYLEWYDVPGRLLAGFTSDVLLVDVGGGQGHEVQGFHEQFGKGKLVLQDLPRVIDGIAEGALDSSIMRIANDFFADQPVKGEFILALYRRDWD
jgi:hypothetical protein